jgi:hypothetical protein
MRSDVFFGVLTAWAVCWIVVMCVYGSAAYKSWRAANGLWRAAPRECIGFLRWFVRELWGDIRHGFHHYPEQMPQRYTPGHLLRFFIGISAFVCGMMGFASASADRSEWPPLVIGVILFAVSLSIFAAMGHLSLAWRDRPRRWRLFVLAVFAWIPLMIWMRS